MIRTKTGVSAAALVALAIGAGAALHAESGNGAFLTGFRTQDLGNKRVSAQFEIHCNPGFTCGYANVEVDWDDGSAIDSINGYVYPVSQDIPLEEEFIHEYAQNGLYHADMSIDDDLGNWWADTVDFNISS